MILAQNWPKTAKSSWHCSFKCATIHVYQYLPMVSDLHDPTSIYIDLGHPKSGAPVARLG